MNQNGITAGELRMRYKAMNAPLGDFVYIVGVPAAERRYEARPQPIARPLIIGS
jgi:hypothetical protein